MDVLRSNYIVNNAYEWALRIVYDIHNSSYPELLMTKNKPTIHQHNINVLIKEIYKFINDLSPPLINDMFQVRKVSYNLRDFHKNRKNKKKKKKKKTVKMGLETISYFALQLWNLVSTENKNVLSLSTFKEKIKSWLCDNCPCRLCKTYIASVGLV